MAQQGSYPIGNRVLAPTDTVTGVVTGLTADIPLSALGAYVSTLLSTVGITGGTIANVTISNSTGQFVSLTAPGTNITGTAGSLNIGGNAATATAIAGGAANQILFQTGSSVTGVISTPVTPGTVLGWTGSGFSWVNAPAATNASNLAGGTANQIPVQSGVSTTTFIAAPVTASTFLSWTGSAYAWATVGTVTSVAVSGGATGLTTSGGPITSSGTITLAGTLVVANGGTGGTTQATARSGIGAAASGANSDITSLSGLTTPLSIAQGGTNATTAAAAVTNLGIGPLLKRLAPNFANASCMIRQRALTPTMSSTRQIGACDNIGVWASSGTVSAGSIGSIPASSPVGTTGYALRLTGVTITGTGVISVSIRMESYDAIKYKNKTASFSVRVYHTHGSSLNYTLLVNKASAVNNFATTTNIATGTATSVTTATDTLLTFNGVSMGDTTNGIELLVQVATGAVTSETYYFTEFYGNIEASAGTYDVPAFEDELLRCLRYLPSFNNVANGASSSGQTAPVVALGQATTTTTASFLFQYPVAVLTLPTALTSSSVGTAAFTATAASGTANSVSALALGVIGYGSCMFTATTTGLVAGGASQLALTSNQAFILTGGEL